MNDQKNNLMSDISSLLGFDPGKGARPTAEAFTKAIDKIAEERQKAAETQAEEKTRQLIKLAEERAKQRKEFEKQEQEFQKQAAKLLNEINSVMRGSEGNPTAEEDLKSEELTPLEK